MTTKDLKDAKDALPNVRTPNYLPLLSVAHELAQLADALGCAENTDPHPLTRDHELVDEISAQLARLRKDAEERAKPPAPIEAAPVAIPVAVPLPAVNAP